MNADRDDEKPKNSVQSHEDQPLGQDDAYPAEDVGLDFTPASVPPSTGDSTPTRSPAWTMFPASETAVPPPTGGSMPTSSDQTAVWYTGQRGGQLAGPYTLPALKKQLATRMLSPHDLVWKAGMPNWIPARETPDLNTRAGDLVGIPWLPSGMFERSNKLLRHVDSILSNAVFYRIWGRICIAAALITFLMSVLLSFWHLTWWFMIAVLFLAIGLGGEATGRMFDLLHRIESQLKERVKPTKDSCDNGSEHD